MPKPASQPPLLAADGRPVDLSNTQHIRWFFPRGKAGAPLRVAAINTFGIAVWLPDVATAEEAEELARQYGFTELERNWNGTIRAWRPKGGAA